MTLQKINKKLSRVVSIITVISFVFCPRFGFALPEGERVVAGSATFTRDGSRMDINQSTAQMIAEYNKFNIGQLEGVYFHQPDASSVALNRVVGVDPSTIMGILSSNGRIFLVNPNGILFGASSRVDTAGLVASTVDIKNEDFMAGRYTFFGQGGSVVNQGYISAPGGYVALLGSTVENAGVIEANLGSVVLASGEAITLNMDPKGLIEVVIDQATSQNLQKKDDAVKNTGSIMANGGKVILTAKTLDGVFKKAINNEGVLEATTLDNKNGVVELRSNGIITNDGIIRTNVLDEQGYIFETTGTIEGGDAYYDNLDGAAYISGNIGSNQHDSGDLIVNGNVTLTANNLVFYADDNNKSGGDFKMNPNFSITDGVNSYNLTIRSGTDATHGTGNVELRTVDIGGNLAVSAYGGSIKESASNVSSLLASSINLAARSIGTSSNEINTKTADLTATSTNGSIYIANSNSSSTSASLNAEDDISMTQKGGGALTVNNATASNGNIDISVDKANLTATSVTANCSTPAISLSTTNSGNIYIGSVKAEDETITVNSAGSIENATSGGSGLTADTLDLTAVNGIGILADALKTVVSNLDVTNTTSGNINIANTGNLTLDTVSNNGGGSTTISAASSITVDNGINTHGGDLALNATSGITQNYNGDITTAGGSYNADAGNGVYTMNHNDGNSPSKSADINTIGTSRNGSVQIKAADIAINIADHGTNPTIKTGSGNVTLLPVAGKTIGLGSGSGNFSLTNNEINAITTSGMVTVGDANSGNVQASGLTPAHFNNLTVTTGGTINDTGSSNAVTVSNLTLNGANGIGTTSTFNINAGTLNASTSNKKIDITEADNVALGLVNAGSGNVSLNAGDNITNNGTAGDTNIIADTLDIIADAIGASTNNIGTQVSTINSATARTGGLYITNKGNVAVITAWALGDASIKTTNGGDLTVGGISANHAILNSAGSIKDDNIDSTLISANNIDLTAAGNIGGLIKKQSGLPDFTPMIDVALGSGTLHANAGGNIYIAEQQASNLLTSKYSLSSSGIGNDIGLINTAGNLTVDSVVSGGDDSIWLGAKGNIDVNSSFTTAGQRLGVHAFGDININTDAVLASGKYIEIDADANGDHTTGAINQTGGTIGQGFEDLFATAAQGIHLDTIVAGLQATNTGTGDITIHNTGSLTLKDIPDWGLGYAVSNANGKVDISTSSPLIVDSKVSSSGDVNLYAAGGDTGDLTVGADVKSANGNVFLSADNNIIVNSGVISSNQYINLDSNHDWAGIGGGVTQNGGTIGSGVEGINFGAWDNIALKDVRGSNVRAVSYNGGISDAGTTSVTADNLFLQIAKGIDLHTAVSNLSAENWTSGDINVINDGALNLVSLSGIYGPGAILGSAAVKNIAGDVKISAIGGNAANLNVNADVQSTVGNVTLKADNDVNLAANVSSADKIKIAADAGTSNNRGIGKITQASGIIGHGIESLELSAATGIGSNDQPLNTQVSNLAAKNSTSGNININNIGNLAIKTIGEIAGVTNRGGGITLSALNNGDDVSSITVASDGQVLTNGADIALNATGDVNVYKISTDGTSETPFTGTATPASGKVTVNAGRDIQDAYDVTPTQDSIYDISANNIVLNALGNIGTTYPAPIELRSSALSILNSGVVNLYHRGVFHFGGFTGTSFSLTNSGDLYIDNAIVTTGGGINLSVIDDPDLYINALLNSNGSDINLAAVGNITQNANGDVLTGGGKYTANADSDNSGSGTYTMKNSGLLGTSAADIKTNGGDVKITAADMDIQVTSLRTNPSINAGSGNVTLLPTAGRSIGLGFSAPGAFNLTNTELARITTSGMVTIGDNNSGNITANSVNLLNTFNFNKLTLNTAGTINDTNDLLPNISISDLTLNAANGIGTTSTLNINADTLAAQTNNADINITELNNVALNLINAGKGNVTLRALAGAISDNNASNANIIGNSLNIQARNGIGSGDALETAVSTLQANNSSKNNIEIVNSGDLNAASVINTASNGDVNLVANSNLTVGTVSSARDVNLSANTGSILDGNGDANNITGTDLVLSAANGIGLSNDALDTVVSNLAAINTTSGDIYVTNTGALNITTIGSVAGVTNNDGKVEVIAKSGDLNVNADVKSLHSAVTLMADNDVNLGANVSSALKIRLNADYDLNHTGAITQTAGSVGSGHEELVASAAEGININTAQLSQLQATNSTSGDINVINSGNLVLDSINDDTDFAVQNLGTGNVNISTTGNGNLGVLDVVRAVHDITLSDGTVGGDVTIGADINSGSGNVTVNAEHNINQTAGIISASNKTITLNAAKTIGSGIISQASGALIGSGHESLVLNAANGIGSDRALDTQVASLQATNATSGDIKVANTGDITLLSVVNNAVPGLVDISAASDITVGSIASSIVNLVAGSGSIKDDLDDSTKITADNINLTAAGDIGGLIDNPSGGLPNFTPMIDVALGSGHLTANAGGNIYIGERNASNLLTSKYSLQSSGHGTKMGLANFTTNGDLTVDTALSGGDDSIWVGAARDVYVRNSFSTTGDTLGVYAFRNVIIDNNASSLASGNKIDIKADADGNSTGKIDQTRGTVGSGNEKLTLRAAEGININKAKVSQLQAKTTAGSINVNNTGNLDLTDIWGGEGYAVKNTGNGDVNIVTVGNLFVLDNVSAGGNITLNADSSTSPSTSSLTIQSNVQSTNGNVTLTADKDITQDNGIVSAGNGKKITLTADQDGNKTGKIQQNNGTIGSGVEQLLLTAAEGIKVVNSAVKDLAAYNSKANDIDITNNGNLNIARIGSTYGVKNDANDKDVKIKTIGGGITLSESVTAKNKVKLNADGAIIDGHTGSSDVKANSAELIAKNGIGTAGNALDTEVANLAAYNSTDGDINISNDGGLTITNVGSTNGVKNDAPNGNVTVSASSPLTVNSAVQAAKNITLTASGHSYGDDLTVNANITSTNNGTIDLNAGDDYTQNNSSAVSTGGLVDIDANGDVVLNNSSSINGGTVNIDAGDAMTMNSTSNITSAGDANIHAGDNIALGLINALNAYINSSNGAITDNNGSSNNITANNLTLNAKSGIGTSSNAIETIINALTASTTNGGIYLSNAGDLALNAITASNGDVSLTSVNGAITDNNGSSNNITANNLTLNAANGIGSGNALETVVDSLKANNSSANNIEIVNNGDLNATSVTNSAAGGSVNLTVNSNLTVGTISSAGDVNLTANTGSILDGNGSSNNITANNLTLKAANNIGSSSDLLDTNVNTLAIISAANAYINQAKSITLNNINVNGTSGTFKLTTPNNAAVTSALGTKITANLVDIAAGGAIDILTKVNQATLSTSNDNITVNEEDSIGLNSINAGSANVVINATNGAITDNNGSSNNITANNLTLNAKSGIGSTGALETEVNTLAASNSTSGDINLANDGGLTITGSGVTNNGGSVNISASSPLTVNSAVQAKKNITLTANDEHYSSDNLTVNANITSTENGTIDLNAGDDYIQNGTSLVSTGGTVNIDAGSDMTMNNSSSISGGTINIDAGDDFRMNGTSSIGASGDANITAGGEALVSNSTLSGNNVSINAVDNITLGVINAINKVYLNTSHGAIVDNNDSSNNITAASLEMKAKNGIGSGTTLETDVDNLAAYNSSSGDINVKNAGSLNITKVGSTTGVKNDAHGKDVKIQTASGDIKLSKSVTADHTVNLNSAGAIIDNNGGTDVIADNAELIAGNGIDVDTNVDNIAAYNAASGDINVNNDGSLTVTHVGNTYGVRNDAIGGGVSITADSDNSTNLTINEQVASNGGNINLSAKDDIVQQIKGNISTNGGNFTANADSNGRGIGGYYMNGRSINTTGDGVDGNVAITAGKNNNGGQDIDVGIINAGNGDVNLTTYHGSIHDIVAVGSLITADTLNLLAPHGNILNLTTNINHLLASAGGYINNLYDIGDLTLDNVTAGTYANLRSAGNMSVTHVSAPNSVTLTSDNGSIIGVAREGANIETSHLTLNADNGSIYGAYNPDESGYGYLTTKIDSLDAYAAYLIKIWDLGHDGQAVTVNNAVTDAVRDLSVDIVTTNDMNVGYVYDRSDVSLTSLFGNIIGLSTGDVNVRTGDLTLNANNGSIYGLGATGALVTDINNLYAYAGGSISLNDIDSLNLVDVQGGLKQNDDVTITANNDINVGHVYDPLNVYLTSNNGSIRGLETDFDANVETGTLTMNAAGDINNLTTNIDDLYAYAGGSIDIFDLGSLTLDDVQGGLSKPKDVTITANDDITVGYVYDPLKVTLTSNFGNIYGTETKGANVDTDSGLGTLIMNAGGVISGLTTNIGDLYAYAQSIDVTNLGSFTADEVIGGGTGSVNLTANDGDLYVNYVSDPADVTLTAKNGDIVGLDPTNSPADNVNISTPALSLSASGDIWGYVGGALVTDAGTISNANAGGSIRLDDINESNVNLGNLTANGTLDNGNLDIHKAVGDMTITGTLTSANAHVRLFLDKGSLFAQGSQMHIVSGSDSLIQAPFGKVLGLDKGTLNFSITKGNLFVDISNPDVALPDYTDYGRFASSNSSVVLLNTHFPSPMNPPGYVWLNGLLIWPPTSGSASGAAYASGLEDSFKRYGKAYYQMMKDYRITSFDGGRVNFYLYHPITPSDFSAFDNINLDIGAYDFIDGNLGVKNLPNFYGGIK